MWYPILQIVLIIIGVLLFPVAIYAMSKVIEGLFYYDREE